MYKVGDIIVIKSNTGSHNYTLGQKYRVISVNAGSQSLMAESLDNTFRGNNLRYNEIAKAVQTKEDITDEIEKLDAEIMGLESRIAYLDESGKEEFDETEHNVWMSLKIVEDPEMSREDKMAELMKLIL